MKTSAKYIAIAIVLAFWGLVAMPQNMAIMPVSAITVAPYQESAEHSVLIGNLPHCSLMGGFDAEIIYCNSVDIAITTTTSRIRYIAILQTTSVVDIPFTRTPAGGAGQIVTPTDNGSDDTPTTIKGGSDHGNHYGNDSKPDRNPTDVKNKHNGCDSDCTGGNKNKDKEDKK